MNESINIIGAGLAGTEAAYQAALRGIPVKLYEMRPQQMTPAHKGGGFAELVCSNSLRAYGMESAIGLLKEEMRLMDSLIIRAALAARVPAGGALAVDRKMFSDYIEAELNANPLVNIVKEQVLTIPDGLTIIAAGPLVSLALSESIADHVGGEMLYFHDAIAPIVAKDSIDMEKVFFASRYAKGNGDDYINCPLDKEQYQLFYQEILAAELYPLKDFEEQKLFSGCMPIEAMAACGYDTMRFGPLKPVGLEYQGKEPYAVVQLRQDDAGATMFNMVGFQTRLKRAEQERVFHLITGLEMAEFLRYGQMHKNTYINSPRLLNNTLQLKQRINLLFAGQITGVEGYVESAACGLAAGINGALLAQGKEPLVFPPLTALGALLRYITTTTGNFQPMNVNFGLLPPLGQKIRDKRQKNLLVAERSLAELKNFIAANTQAFDVVN